ncbi:MAG: DEAD/DEAH box helicase [Polyangiaceae bacterium]
MMAPDGVQVLYVSPLKALSNDVQKNLRRRLRRSKCLAPELGLSAPEVRTAVRTGDTPQGERQKMMKRPPHVLVTTPESLFILLTSEGGRRALATVRAVVIDEIHAVLGDKRGTHLAIVARAARRSREARVARRAAAHRPLRDGAAGRHGGAVSRGRGAGAAVLVMPPPARERELFVETPASEPGAATTHEQWAELYDRSPRSRRRCERPLLWHVRGARGVPPRRAAGSEAVAAHHGSLARDQRLAAEQRLKAGISSFAVPWWLSWASTSASHARPVCLVGSPRSIGAALQRVGRSGHALGAVSRGRFFPMTRDQLVESAAIERAAGPWTRPRCAPPCLTCSRSRSSRRCERRRGGGRSLRARSPCRPVFRAAAQGF